MQEACAMVTQDLRLAQDELAAQRKKIYKLEDENRALRKRVEEFEEMRDNSVYDRERALSSRDKKIEELETRMSTCRCSNTDESHDWNCPENPLVKKLDSLGEKLYGEKPAQGWMCPVCKCGNAPWSDRCGFCRPPSPYIETVRTDGTSL